MEKVILPDGKTNNILINFFPALDGWEIQSRFKDYVRSEDKEFKRAFTIEILSYSEVVLEEVTLPLKTSDLIQNHLRTWQNIQQIFEAVLRHNGIDPESHAEKAGYWDNVGKELAISFIAEATKLMAPAISMASVLNFPEKEDK